MWVNDKMVGCIIVASFLSWPYSPSISPVVFHHWLKRTFLANLSHRGTLWTASQITGLFIICYEARRLLFFYFYSLIIHLFQCSELNWLLISFQLYLLPTKCTTNHSWQLRARGHDYTLSSIRFDVFINAFVNRCLFSTI